MYGRHFDPVMKIASILEGVEQRDVSNIEAPHNLLVAGRYLGGSVDQERFIDSLAAEPQTDIVTKLMLANLGYQIGSRLPAMKYMPEVIVEATAGGFLQSRLHDAIGEAFFGIGVAEESREMKYFAGKNEDPFYKHLGVNLDVKLVADDIGLMIHGAEHRLKHAADFRDVVYLVGCCLYRDYVDSGWIREDMDRIIKGNDHTPKQLFSMIAMRYCQNSISQLNEINATRLLAGSKRKRDVMKEVKVVLDLSCNLNYDDFPELAFAIDQRIQEAMNRVMISEDGLHLDLKQRLIEFMKAGKRKESIDMMNKIGMTEEMDFINHSSHVAHIDYRGVPRERSVRQYLQFLEELPERILKAPKFDPRDNDFRKDDAVVVYQAGKIINYEYHYGSFCPALFPLGTTCTVVDVEGMTVSVKRQGDEKVYRFHAEEIAKIVPVEIFDSRDVELVREDIEHIIKTEQLKHRFVFEPGSYKDDIRSCIYHLLETGMTIREIQQVIGLDDLGITEFDHGDDLREWLPEAGEKPFRPAERKEGLERVVQIFTEHPGLFEFSRLEQSEREGSLAYLLMPDSNINMAKAFSDKEYMLERFTLAFYSVYFSNDEIGAHIEYEKRDILEMMSECSRNIYHNLIGSKWAGSNPRAMTGRNDSRILELAGDPVMGLLKSIMEGPSEQRRITGNDVEVEEVEFFPGSLLEYKLFQGLKAGVDTQGAAELYMQKIAGFEGLVDEARSTTDLRYILGISIYGNTMGEKDILVKLKQGRTYGELFLETILMFIDKAIARTS
ncbi:MAG: hypothetical protein ABIJ08_01380 [Nanoarchaeota archaeon]